jgi:nicotinamide riboside kinase
MQNMKKTTVINLFGSPGSGKSTFAADLFSEMKKHDYEVEMVREWVKLWAWEGKQMSYGDQIVIFGHQVHEETTLYGKVNIIITDSPFILSAFYEEVYYGTNHLLAPAKNLMKLSEKNGTKYWNLLLKRDWPYQPNGRFQTEDEAQELDKKMIKFLRENKFPYEPVVSVEDVMIELLQ